MRDLQPGRTWPESQRPAVFDHLRELAGQLGEHSSYLAFFVDWEYIGALCVQSSVVLSSAEDFWEQRSEPVCLVTGDLRDGLFLDYEDPDHMAVGDEYELNAWGAFAPIE